MKIFAENILLPRFQRLGLDLLVLVHLHDERAQEVHGLHVPEQIGKGVCLADALQSLLSLGIVLNLHGLLELGGRLGALALHVFHDHAHGALKGAYPVLCQLFQRSLQVYARVGEVLHRVRREDFLQEVAHIGRGFIVGARALSGDLQGGGHFHDGLLPGDPHAGKGRGQLGQKLRHVLQFHKAGLTRRGKDIEGFVQLLVRDAQVVSQGKRGRAKVIHACPGRRRHLSEHHPVTFQLLAALHAAGDKHLHPLKDIRLELIGLPRDVSHGKGQLRLVFLAHAAGNGDVADGILLPGRRTDGHARRDREGGPGGG